MTAHRDGEPREVAEVIMRYLRDHADAADTADGIARWWTGRDPPESLETIERVLTMLVEQGLVERQTLPDGAIVYRNPHHTRPPGSTTVH